MSKTVEITFLKDIEVEVIRDKDKGTRVIVKMEDFPAFVSVKDENGKVSKHRNLSIWEKGGKPIINIS